VKTRPLRVFAPAKVNLFLHVGDKRNDGFHALESLAVFVDAGDHLTFDRAEELSLCIEGPFARDLMQDDDNLVLRAARALNAKARIVLTKNLPVASGIGGGSADAAAALRGLNEFCGFYRSDLAEVAADLGSDVPVCLTSRAAWMEGRGEILTPATVPRIFLVLVNPGIAVSTAEVFRALTKRSGLGWRKTDRVDLAEVFGTTSNDLEIPARKICPPIGIVLDALSEMNGVRLARMSGSGATCFAIFDSAELAADAAQVLSNRYSDWWVHAAKTL
jgi:4-diphosphocytidyl-2-C-methyl-D-erythritol kinase